MKRIYHLSILLLLLNSGHAFSQTLTIGTSGTPLRELKRADELGSPYFNPQFLASDVVSAGGNKFSLPAIRYNLLNQEVEYMDKDEVYKVQDSLRSFRVIDNLGRSHLLEKKVMDNKPLFFETLAQGKVALFKRYTAKTTNTEDWYTKKKVTTIVPEVTYYVLKGEEFERFSASKKSVLSLFNDKAEQIKTFINNNPTDFKSDESLKDLFTFYNSLSGNL
jgi:hypothetical protein